MKHLKHLASVVIFLLCGIARVDASLATVYIGSNAAGGDTGANCANQHAASFFNTSGNWGASSTQIGGDTVVHLCGTLTGGTAANLLQFQGSGTSGHPVSLVFETGAIIQASYCAVAGCIDLNGQDYLVIDGGTVCGKGTTAVAADTACNGLIQNTLAGSSGQTCPAGACTSNFTDAVRSVLIGSGSGTVTNLEVKNLHLGPVYVRDPTVTTADGTNTYALLLADGTLPEQITMHHVICHDVFKCYTVSLGSASTTVAGYRMHHASVHDACWAMGVGAAASTMHMNDVEFYASEVQTWDPWVRYPTNCHPNGTMWFNGDGSTIYGSGGICESGCLAYNNYIHGDMGAGYCCGSASGMLSCQDNCKGGYWFNNLLISTCDGINPTRSCGGIMYFNGAGGGGQGVYNNTIIGAAGECTTNTGLTANVIAQNNIFQGCPAVFEIRPNTPAVITSDYNVGYGVDTSIWTIYNTAVGLLTITLTNWRGTYSQDVHSVTTDPKLTGAYHLQSGSSAIGLGLDLTSLGVAALNADAAGVARPSGSNWDAGAYQFATPTGLGGLGQFLGGRRD